MRLFRFAFFLLVAGLAASPVARAEGTRVLRSDDAVLDVELSLGAPGWESVPGEGRTFRRPHVPGGLHRAAAGDPDVPSIVRLIGVPPEGEPRVRVLSVDSSTETVPDLAPGPEQLIHPAKDKDSQPFVSEKRTAVRATAGMSPARWAEIDGTFWVRGQRMARLVFHPFRYDASRHEMATARRLVARVEFGKTGRMRAATRRDSEVWERTVDGVLLNADVARAWRRSPPPARRGGADSFDSAPTWLRVPIDRGGVYLLDYFTFSNLGIDPATIDPGTVRVFSGTNLPLREEYTSPPPAFMTENALLPLDDDPVPDSIFDVDDRFLFYALGPHGWASEYDPSRPRTEYVENPYTDSTVYWITWGGSFSAPAKRMADRMVSPAVGPATSLPYRVHFEENNVEDFRFRAEDGWQWENLLGRGANRLYGLELDRVASGDGAILARILSHGASTEFVVRDVEVKVVGQIVADSVWTHTPSRAVIDMAGCFSNRLNEGINAIRVNAKTILPGSIDRIYTTWFDIEYDRSLTAKSGSYVKFLSASQPPAEVDSTCVSMLPRYGLQDFRIDGFQTSTPGKSVYVFDVSDQHDVQRLTGWGNSPVGGVSSVSFHDTAHAGSTGWYVATTMQGVLPLPAPEIADIRGLRSTANAADYLVIHHPMFREGAERLAEIRRNVPGRADRTMAVDVDDIYDEFSWGMVDPVAVRDFLVRAQGWNVRPFFVAMVGDAAYDTKKFLSGSPDNLLSTYIGRYRTDPLIQYVSGENLHFFPTDDFFGYLDVGDYAVGQQPALDVAIGRFPVPTTDALDLMLDKLESYASYESPGQWQNRVLLAADDERTLQEGAREPWHTQQVERLSTERFPPALDRVKIYLTEFQRNDFGKKPEAQTEFIDEFTRGALMVTYTGHGDQNTMAQEEVFVAQKIPSLLNEHRYCVFSTFSCTVSRFDLLSGNAMTELLLVHPDGGALTTFASAGLVFPQQSAQLNQEWLGAMFGTPFPIHTFARTLRSIGTAGLLAKVIVNNSRSTRQNSEKYVLLGDPALEVRYGQYPIEFETATVDSQTTEGLLRVVRGTVRSELGAVLDGSGPDPAFNGTAFVHVTEQRDESGYDYDLFGGGGQGHIAYALDGPTTYRGRIAVVDGRFEAKFFLSEAIQSGNQARISVFALDDGSSRAASGAADSLSIAPTISPGQVNDAQGPAIKISFEGHDNFVNGDFVFTDKPVLVVEMDDVSGINLRPFPEFALLAAEVDGRDKIDLANDFSYEVGTFTRGRVRRIVPLSAGSHTLEVKAFDNVGNRATQEVEFTVVLPSSDFAIEKRSVAVYPNPFVDSAEFLFQLTHDADVDLKVFTVSGRKIWETGAFSAAEGQNRVRWNGRDSNGRSLANGTYLFKVEASYTDPGEQVQSDEFVGHVVRMR